MIDTALRILMHRDILRIRMVEERIAGLYPEGEMKCPVHLCTGQEATSAGVCAAVQPGDSVFSAYRSHGLYLSLGAKLPEMLAELYGKRTGCCSGKSGSMQLVAPEHGLLCTSAIVGGTIPMAAGAALAYKMRKKKSVAFAFFGDGATEEGPFHESMNFASLHKLPVVFVCENNLFAVYTPLSKRQCADNIFERAQAYAMPGTRVDGNKVEEVYEAVRIAAERARAGEGPTLIECRTYRWLEHVGPNSDIPLGVRTQDELDAWKLRCPLDTYEKLLMKDGVLTDLDVRTWRKEISEEIDAAVTFAKDSPFPTDADMREHVYA